MSNQILLDLLEKFNKIKALFGWFLTPLNPPLNSLSIFRPDKRTISYKNSIKTNLLFVFDPQNDLFSLCIN
jgi:hypothetical protein